MSALAGGSVPDSESTSREAENRLLELQRKTRDELCSQRITLHLHDERLLQLDGYQSWMPVWGSWRVSCEKTRFKPVPTLFHLPQGRDSVQRQRSRKKIGAAQSKTWEHPLIPVKSIRRGRPGGSRILGPILWQTWTFWGPNTSKRHRFQWFEVGSGFRFRTSDNTFQQKIDTFQHVNFSKMWTFANSFGSWRKPIPTRHEWLPLPRLQPRGTGTGTGTGGKPGAVAVESGHLLPIGGDAGDAGDAGDVRTSTSTTTDEVWLLGWDSGCVGGFEMFPAVTETALGTWSYLEAIRWHCCIGISLLDPSRKVQTHVGTATGWFPGLGHKGNLWSSNMSESAIQDQKDSSNPVVSFVDVSLLKPHHVQIEWRFHLEKQISSWWFSVMLTVTRCEQV